MNAQTQKTKGIPLGPGLYYTEDRHLLLIALSRTGKGRDVQIPALLEYPAPMIVIDPKGQLAAVTMKRREEMGHKVYIINPFHEDLPFKLRPDDKYDGFNPLLTLDPKKTSFVEQVRSLCEAIVVDSGDRESYWTSSARNLLAGFIMYCVKYEDEKTLGRVRENITFDRDARQALLERMSKKDYDPLREQVTRFLGTAKEFENHFSTLDDHTTFISSPAIKKCLGTDSGLRFSDMKEKDITVYIVVPPAYLQSQARFLRLIIQMALTGLYQSPLPQGRLPVLFMLDEFSALGHLSRIEDAIGAAAGYGVQLWPAIQNLPQLQGLYRESWETFIDNTGALQILGTNNNTTAKYFSEKAGETTAQVPGQSITFGADGRPSIGESMHEVSVPLLRPLEFGRLKKDEQIIFFYGHGVAKCDRMPYYEQAKYKGKDKNLYAPDPYHLAEEKQEPVAE